MRGGREMEDHFECLWDLFRSIPSIGEAEGVSVLDEYYWLNKQDPNVLPLPGDGTTGAGTPTPTGSSTCRDKGCMEIMKLFFTPDEDLYDKTHRRTSLTTRCSPSDLLALLADHVRL